MEATWINRMESPVNAVLEASCLSIVLTLIVAAITWACRGRIRANWRFALWMIVFVRLATPLKRKLGTNLF